MYLPTGGDNDYVGSLCPPPPPPKKKGIDLATYPSLTVNISAIGKLIVWHQEFVKRLADTIGRSVLEDGTVGTMDQIFIKTLNPKCRLYWCLIEFIN
jgi:hypothetical protein